MSSAREHTHEAGSRGTDVGEDIPHNLNLDEAEVFHRACLLVPLEYRLPHGWHMSNAGYAIPLLLMGPDLRALNDERRARMMPRQRAQPRWSPTSHD
jgi:hypothetical protein